MDNLLQRQSMDVIGKVAFGRSIGALRSMQDGSQGVNRALDSLGSGATERKGQGSRTGSGCCYQYL